MSQTFLKNLNIYLGLKARIVRTAMYVIIIQTLLYCLCIMSCVLANNIVPESGPGDDETQGEQTKH